MEGTSTARVGSGAATAIQSNASGVIPVAVRRHMNQWAILISLVLIAIGGWYIYRYALSNRQAKTELDAFAIADRDVDVIVKFDDFEEVVRAYDRRSRGGVISSWAAMQRVPKASELEKQRLLALLLLIQDFDTYHRVEEVTDTSHLRGNTTEELIEMAAKMNPFTDEYPTFTVIGYIVDSRGSGEVEKLRLAADRAIPNQWGGGDNLRSNAIRTAHWEALRVGRKYRQDDPSTVEAVKQTDANRRSYWLSVLARSRKSR